MTEGQVVNDQYKVLIDNDDDYGDGDDDYDENEVVDTYRDQYKCSK